MCQRVAFVRTCISEERSPSIIRVERVSELGTLAVNSSNQFLVTANVISHSLTLSTLMVEAIRSSETRFLEEPHSVTLKKTAFFIVTAVRTSNLTRYETLTVKSDGKRPLGESRSSWEGSIKMDLK
jgi:hypothetical protein